MYSKIVKEKVFLLCTVFIHASICIFDPKDFPGMTCYFHNYNLKQSWLDLFSFLTLLRAFNKITSVNSTGLGRSKNLLLSSPNHLHQSKINFVSFYSDPKEKLDLALKAVMVKYKDIFCPFCAQDIVLSHFSSQLEGAKVTIS